MTEVNHGAGNENGESGKDSLYSPELARQAMQRLEVCAHRIIEAEPHHTDVKRVATAKGTIKRYPHWWIEPDGIDSHQHRADMDKTGYVKAVIFRLNGGLRAAYACGRSPVGNEWHARFQFPKVHTERQEEDVERRVVLDLWQTPDNDRSELRSGVGLPDNAMFAEHYVFGRDENLMMGEDMVLGTVLDLFEGGVEEVLRQSQGSVQFD
jgi:hypothetical protein